jgi:hypothetical protein
LKKAFLHHLQEAASCLVGNSMVMIVPSPAKIVAPIALPTFHTGDRKQQKSSPVAAKDVYLKAVTWDDTITSHRANGDVYFCHMQVGCTTFSAEWLCTLFTS